MPDVVAVVPFPRSVFCFSRRVLLMPKDLGTGPLPSAVPSLRSGRWCRSERVMPEYRDRCSRRLSILASAFLPERRQPIQ